MNKRKKEKLRQRRKALQKQQRFVNVRRHAEWEQRQLKQMKFPSFSTAMVTK